MAFGNNFVQNATISDLLIVVLLGWTLVPLWSRWIDNVTFNSFKLSKDSSYQTFVIALFTTLLFLVFVYTFDSVQSNFFQEESGFNPPVPVGQNLQGLYFDQNN